MASKYLSAGTATWTNSTRTISAATMTPVFESGDATNQRQVIFRIGASIYYGRVNTYVSATSVTLLSVGTLPSGDGTIAELFLLDLSEAHTYQQYKDELASMIKDGQTKLSGADLDLIIAQAVRKYSQDKPYFVKKKVTGTGVSSYLLTTIFGSLWKAGFSQIKSIEHPAGDNPPTMLEEDDYYIYDDGTAQDETNLKLVFTTATPATSESFSAELSIELDLPTSGTQNFPNTDEHFANITTLAAALACMRLAAVYAQSSDSSISADVVNYHEKTQKYMSLAKQYLSQYKTSVFGSEEDDGPKAAMIDKDVDLSLSTGRPFVFHSSKYR